MFIDKLEMTISDKVRRHEAVLSRHVLGTPHTAAIWAHILGAKCKRAQAVEVRTAVTDNPISPDLVRAVLGHIVEQKFEQRSPSGDVHDGLLLYLCGEQAGKRRGSQSGGSCTKAPRTPLHPLHTAAHRCTPLHTAAPPC